MKLAINRKKLQKAKKQIETYPEVCGLLGAVTLTAILLWAFWGPVTNGFRESILQGKNLVYESFSLPLARALASGDDLTGVDELRRLQKIPGIAFARFLKEGEPGGFPLIWQGKNVGALELRMSFVPLRKWEYRSMERGWSLVLLMGFLGGLAGWGYRRAHKHLLKRLITLSDLRHKNHLRHLHTLKITMEKDLTEWSYQSMGLSPYGLILLDAGQRVVSFNRQAQDMLKLNADAAGSHWMDIYRSPEWADALRQTLEHPGERVRPFTAESGRGISLLTFTKVDKSISATWIVIHSVAFVPNVRELAVTV